jgi:hypothetical protein
VVSVTVSIGRQRHLESACELCGQPFSEHDLTLWRLGDRMCDGLIEEDPRDEADEEPEGWKAFWEGLTPTQRARYLNGLNPYECPDCSMLLAFWDEMRNPICTLCGYEDLSRFE